MIDGDLARLTSPAFDANRSASLAAATLTDYVGDSGATRRSARSLLNL